MDGEWGPPSFTGVATDPRASPGIYLIEAWERTVFAIAGDASNAVTPTADRITFRLVLMFNFLQKMLGASPSPQCSRMGDHNVIKTP